MISVPEFAGGEEVAARAEQQDKSEATSGWGAPIAVLRAQPGCSVSSFPPQVATTTVRSSPSSSASSSFIDQMLSLARSLAR